MNKFIIYLWKINKFDLKIYLQIIFKNKLIIKIIINTIIKSIITITLVIKKYISGIYIFFKKNKKDTYK